MALDYSRQQALQIKRILEKVTNLEKRITELERDSGSSQGLSEVSKSSPGRAKKTNVA